MSRHETTPAAVEAVARELAELLHLRYDDLPEFPRHLRMSMWRVRGTNIANESRAGFRDAATRLLRAIGDKYVPT